MSTSDVIAIVSAVIAAISALFAGLAFSYSRGVRKRDLQGRRKARLRAEISSTGQSYWRLFVVNTGQGTARNVAITLDGKSLLEHPLTRFSGEECKSFGPDFRFSYAMVGSMPGSPPIKLKATWVDDSGQADEYSTTLTF